MPRGKPKHFILNKISPYFFEARSVPDGYTTVTHWWAFQERDAFAIAEGLLDVLKEEEAAVHRLATVRNICAVAVDACPYYERLGREAEFAYPKAFLAEFYPFNP